MCPPWSVLISAGWIARDGSTARVARGELGQPADPPARRTGKARRGPLGIPHEYWDSPDVARCGVRNSQQGDCGFCIDSIACAFASVRRPVGRSGIHGVQCSPREGCAPVRRRIHSTNPGKEKGAPGRRRLDRSIVSESQAGCGAITPRTRSMAITWLQVW